MSIKAAKKILESGRTISGSIRLEAWALLTSVLYVAAECLSAT
jgi:hypothetical protein